MTAIGVLGGTFNPPHLAHLAVARHARDELGLERVLLTPAHIAPHKDPGEDPGAGHRLRMCELAAQGESRLEVCGVELERGGPSYTVDTLQAIHASHPGAQLTFIVGADIAHTLPGWREPKRLLGLAGLAVAARSGSDRDDLLEIVSSLTPHPAAGDGSVDQVAPARVRFLEMDAIELSSSSVRARVARGEPVERLVGERVARYIEQHDLYRTPARAGR